jgi:hypothetical protein
MGLVVLDEVGEVGNHGPDKCTIPAVPDVGYDLRFLPDFGRACNREPVSYPIRRK